MTWSKLFRPRAGLVLMAGALLVPGVAGEEKPPLAVRDVSKMTIEVPIKRLVETGKQKPVPQADALANPKVEPGKVRWHADFDAARAAAAKSGKPVLLFQLMGKLDERFC